MNLEQRLAHFPKDGLKLRKPVRIRWNRFAVPYIDADSAEDAAYALGLVHYHLRSTQIEVALRLAQGRLSEMLGPFTVELDHALRLLDLEGAGRSCEQVLPADSRRWVERFALGLKDASAGLRQKPREWRWLGLRPTPWTSLDVLTLGRLAGADVNWSSYLTLLKHRQAPNFDRLWKRLRIIGGTLSLPLMSVSRSGSNSVVVGASRSASGAPLMANDPHLSQTLPSFWILAGLRYPGSQMVGLMPAGLPFVGVGASRHMVWGGTNMRAASSDLVDVSSLPDQEIDSRRVRIRVRGLGWRSRRVRRTRFGPILNDARMLRVQGGSVALKWMGHQASDEIGAFLRAAGAENAQAFRQAFVDFGVCAQNILFACRENHQTGHVYAAHLPRRSHADLDKAILSPEQAARAWRHRWDAGSLPMSLDPVEGYRVSANDKPRFSAAPLGIFFSEGDRAKRLAELVRQVSVDRQTLIELQNDALVPGARSLASALADRLEPIGGDRELIRLLRIWRGDYAAESRAAVIFETLIDSIARDLKRHPGTDLDDEWGRHTRLLLRDLDELEARARLRVLRRALERALSALRRYPNWGDMHRLRIIHFLGLIPGLSRAFRVTEWPAAGSRESPMKNSHGLVSKRHFVEYGAQARHLSDLSDLDANEFVLLGGNDGWIGSQNSADQLPLWRNQQYLRMPLREVAIRKEFPVLTSLLPSAAPKTSEVDQAKALPVTSGEAVP